MTRNDIIIKLGELGIVSSNCYPKSSFITEFEPCVGLYPAEMADDFYFWNTYDGKLYVFKKKDKDWIKDNLKTNSFLGKTKYVVPISECQVVWDSNVPEPEKEEDSVYSYSTIPEEPEDFPDESMNSMTIRRYACIHLGVPETDLPWLNEIIKKGKK